MAVQIIIGEKFKDIGWCIQRILDENFFTLNVEAALEKNIGLFIMKKRLIEKSMDDIIIVTKRSFTGDQFHQFLSIPINLRKMLLLIKSCNALSNVKESPVINELFNNFRNIKEESLSTSHEESIEKFKQFIETPLKLDPLKPDEVKYKWEKIKMDLMISIGYHSEYADFFMQGINQVEQKLTEEGFEPDIHQRGCYGEIGKVLEKMGGKFWEILMEGFQNE